MPAGDSILKKAMKKRGYKHRRTDEQFIIDGEYAGRLQYVYSKETQTRDGLIIDLVYLGADMRDEKLVIGFYRENTDIENGICANTSRSLSLGDISKKAVERELDKLIPPLREKI